MVKDVVNILTMWSSIENSYEKLSLEDKEIVQIEATPFGKHVKFDGFDGNNECSHFSIASFLIDHLNRFSNFKGRDLNSHTPQSVDKI